MNLVTLNLRHDNPADGPMDWAGRREAVLGFLTRGGFDVICLQETLGYQLEEIVAATGWNAVGQPRETSGEICPILSPWPIEVAGQWWISETPAEFGSKGFGTACPRVVTWAVIQGVAIYCVHLDHESALAREMGVRQILADLPEYPWVVMGDFNAESDSPPIQAMREEGIDLSMESSGTFHDFGRQTPATKIDYIFVARELAPGALCYVAEDASLSDHYPVIATIRASM